MSSHLNLGGTAASSLLDFDSSVPYQTFIRNLKLLRVGQIIADLEIILENNRVVFHGPPNSNKTRTVKGKVRLEVAGKLNVKEIMITLAGEFNISGEANYSTANDIPRHGTLFSTCILLANKRTFLPGTHEFFFEFLLPGDLPESMSSDFVLCEYLLKAELVPRYTEELNSMNKVVDIVDLFVERVMLQSDEYIRKGLGATRYIGSKDKVLDFEFLVPRLLRLNADSLRFHARWDGIRVDNVSFWLVQYECLKSSLSEIEKEEASLPATIDRTSKVISGPFRFDLPRSERLKLQSRPMAFQLPIMEPFVHDYDLFGIEIRHKLIISIQMAGRRKENIQFSVPIVVESIVPDVDTLPPPCHIRQTSQSALLYFANKIYYGKTENYIQEKFEEIKRKSIKHTSTQSVRSVIQGNEEQRTPQTIPTRTSSVRQEVISSNNSNSIRSSRNNLNIINIRNSISTISESNEDDETDNNSSENTGTTSATTATYINTEHEKSQQGGFPQKVGFAQQKTTFITSPANLIADRFVKFNFILQQKRKRKPTPVKRNSRSSSSASTIKVAPGLMDLITERNNGHNATMTA